MRRRKRKAHRKKTPSTRTFRVFCGRHEPDGEGELTMGRMLDTMKLGETRTPPLAISKPAGEAPAQDCVVDWELADEVPFVEVGGPNKKVESSSGLMLHVAEPTPRPPHLALHAAAPKAMSVQFAEPKPMSAVFSPWPARAPLDVSTDVIAYHQPEHPTSKEYASLFAMMQRSVKKDGAK